MVDQESSWDFGGGNEWGDDGLLDDWDELDSGSLEAQVLDAFELDDGPGEPDPEYRDLWAERDEDEV